MFEAGATACTASTSRVSSPYQPAAPHSSVRVYWVGSTWLNCPPPYAASPCFAAYVAASAAMVGEAYASVIATVTPLPVARPAPYAARSCLPV